MNALSVKMVQEPRLRWVSVWKYLQWEREEQLLLVMSLEATTFSLASHKYFPSYVTGGNVDSNLECNRQLGVLVWSKIRLLSVLAFLGSVEGRFSVG